MKFAAAVFALLALASLNATAADGKGGNCAFGASECITPQYGGQPRPVTNGVQDVVVDQATIVVDPTRVMPDTCAVRGASECIRPQAAQFSVDPYPTASLSAAQTLPNVYATWSTTSAVAATLVCAGPGGTTFNQAVSTSGAGVALPGSDTWTAGTYTCALSATNVRGRVATATSTFAVLPPYAVPHPGLPTAGHPVLVCQDTATWDPVAYTWTVQLLDLGRYVAGGPSWTNKFVYQYLYNAVSMTFTFQSETTFSILHPFPTNLNCP